MKRIEYLILFITVAVFYVLPTVCFSYRSNFFEVFGKTRFVITYFALPFLITYSFIILVFLVKHSDKRKFTLISETYKNMNTNPTIQFIMIPFITSDFIINIYYFSYYCHVTFNSKTDYLYIVVPISCLYLIALYMYIIDIIKKTMNNESILFTICSILKSFVITTLISPSTIVTNSLLTLFIIPVFYTYFFFEENKPYLLSRRPKKLKKLVRELAAQDDSPASQDDNSGNTDNSQFIGLYQKIQDANRKRNRQGIYEKIFRSADRTQGREVIHHYYSFGKALEDRLDHYKKSNKERTAQALVNEEVRSQLQVLINRETSEQLGETGETDYSFLRQKERAQKIYSFFNEIGEDKIDKVKSFSAVGISELSCDDIDYILAKLATTNTNATLSEVAI